MWIILGIRLSMDARPLYSEDNREYTVLYITQMHHNGLCSLYKSTKHMDYNKRITYEFNLAALFNNRGLYYIKFQYLEQ